MNIIFRKAQFACDIPWTYRYAFFKSIVPINPNPRMQHLKLSKYGYIDHGTLATSKLKSVSENYFHPQISTDKPELLCFIQTF